MPAKIKNPSVWIHTKYEKDPESGCWNWIGSKYSNGYGQSKIPGTRKFCMAHRLTYRLVKGEFDDSLVLDHLCLNRACVNPDHLEPVTQGENARPAGTIDILVALAKKRGAKTTCSKGHLLSGDNLYTYPKEQNHRACHTCMREYRRNYHQSQKSKRTG
jgi:hypothetical protein